MPWCALLYPHDQGYVAATNGSGQVATTPQPTRTGARTTEARASYRRRLSAEHCQSYSITAARGQR